MALDSDIWKLIAQYQPNDSRHQLGTMDIDLCKRCMEDGSIDLSLDASALFPSTYTGHDKMTYADKLFFFRRFIEGVPTTGVGLLVGSKATLSDFGILGYAIINSRSTEEAVITGFKYLNLNGPIFTVKLFKSKNVTMLVAENVLEVDDILPFCCEYFLSALCSLCDELSGEPLDIKCLSFPYSKPLYASKYMASFNCGDVKFDQPKLIMQFCTSFFSRSLKQSYVSVVDNYLYQCDRILQSLQSPYTLPNQIKSMLYQHVGYFPSIEYFATQFGCSTRTLRRQLEQCGTDYQSLLSEVRGDIAKEYLLGTSLTIEEIALRLGYCDGSSFRRKFKRLSGYTPRAYRYAGKELR